MVGTWGVEPSSFAPSSLPSTLAVDTSRPDGLHPRGCARVGVDSVGVVAPQGEAEVCTVYK